MPSLHLGLAQVRHVADGRGHASQCPMAALTMYQLFSMFLSGFKKFHVRCFLRWLCIGEPFYRWRFFLNIESLGLVCPISIKSQEQRCGQGKTWRNP